MRRAPPTKSLVNKIGIRLYGAADVQDRISDPWTAQVIIDRVANFHGQSCTARTNSRGMVKRCLLTSPTKIHVNLYVKKFPSGSGSSGESNSIWFPLCGKLNRQRRRWATGYSQ